MVHFHEFDLAVGDVLQVGELTVTVVDIENGDVTLRIDDDPSDDSGYPVQLDDCMSNLAPR